MARQGVVEEHRNVESRLRFVPDAEQVKAHMKVEANFFTRGGTVGGADFLDRGLRIAKYTIHGLHSKH